MLKRFDLHAEIARARELVRERNFALTRYYYSMGCLLIRSGKQTEVDTNVDIVFFGVSLISLPTMIGRMSIEAGEPADVQATEALLGRHLAGRERTFVITGDSFRGFVVAATLFAGTSNGNPGTTPDEPVFDL